MKRYYYVHTGHRIGLDRFRRAATIFRALGDEEMVLLSSDFRIASVARSFGIKRSVGVDVVRNIPQIANNGDQIIFDSAEINQILLDDMTQYFSTFIRVSDDPNDQKHEKELLISPYLEGEGIEHAVIVDDLYFTQTPKTIKRALFFGDDDYEEDLAKHQEIFKGLDLELLLGFYWFIDYEKKLASTFTTQYEPEEYDEVITQSEVLVTASPQAALENLASGGRPIFLNRPDYPDDFIPLLTSLNIPIVNNFDGNELREILSNIMTHSYQSVPKESAKVAEFLKKSLNL